MLILRQKHCRFSLTNYIFLNTAVGTTEHTLRDFWRMIWEYDITLIVMVTKLTEDGKVSMKN